MNFPDTQIPRNIASLLIVLMAGYILGSSITIGPDALADVRKTPKRQAFQSGGERAETVLREIAATLKRIEGRLDRIERTIVDAAKNRRPATEGGIGR